MNTTHNSQVSGHQSDVNTLNDEDVYLKDIFDEDSPSLNGDEFESYALDDDEFFDDMEFADTWKYSKNEREFMQY